MYRVTPPPRAALTSILAALLLAGCGRSDVGPAPGARGPEPGIADAPWSATPFAWSAVPRPHRVAWEAAENRTRCAPLAPSGRFAEGAAQARRATFGGGWGVAYDLSDTRSAYGVAGTGVNASDPAYEGFPYTIEWTDGSVARYGLEGGSGPNHLAYLRIPGQGCLYNVWSALGRAHLEELLGSLRFVETGEA